MPSFEGGVRGGEEMERDRETIILLRGNWVG